MDNFTESFNPYHKYENFECYVKLNMEYLKTTDGYKFYKIDDGCLLYTSDAADEL